MTGPDATTHRTGEEQEQEQEQDVGARLAEVERLLDRRWPETKPQPSLRRIAALLDLLGAPHQGYPVVHVAGTNGKTSTTRMIDALLSGLGLRTGRYISPHLQSVLERISLDNQPITARRYVETFYEVRPYLAMVDESSAREPDGVPMSKFEVLTGMAFAAFADAPVDAAVVEVGLGGTWDATNVVTPAVSVITPIGVDHVEYLGSDVVGIARDKAGVIKPGSIAVVAEQTPEVTRALLERCVEVEATVARAGVEFGVLRRDVAVGGQLLRLQGLGGVYDEVLLPLHGAHQAGNAAVALATVEAFFGAGAARQLDLASVRAAFASVRSPGRLEPVRGAPTVLLDAAHNPHGARALATALREEFDFRRLVGVLGVMRDKDARGLIGELAGVLDEVVVTQANSPRAMPVDDLAAIAVDVVGADRVTVAPRLDDAVETAIGLAEEVAGPREQVSGAGVVITGSVVTAGQARTLFGRPPQ